MRTHSAASSATPARRPTGRPLLLTGGAGFIGAALARELLAAGRPVVVLDDLSSGFEARLPRAAGLRLVRGDVATPGLLGGLLRTHGPFEAVVHLAATVGVRAVLRDPEACRRANQVGLEELLASLAALPREERPRLYAASSSEVYADSERPLAEGDPLRAEDGRGRWAYAASKLYGERRLDEARGLWPAASAPVHLRFFNVVGPGQDSEGGMVLPSFVERALDGRPLLVHGDGLQQRTFAHVDEVARTLRELVLRPESPGGALNVGGHALTSILELARCVRDQAGGAPELQRVDPVRECGVLFEEIRRREPDLSRLASLGLYVPHLGLEELVRDTLARHGALRAEAPTESRALQAG